MAFLSGAGYGDWKYEPKTLRKRAQRLAKALPAVMQEHNADCIAVRGTSGVVMAAALSMVIDVPIMMMRKPGENSHGGAIEGRSGHNYQRAVIIDDFSATGATVKGMMADMANMEEPVTAVAFVEHRGADEAARALIPTDRTMDLPTYIWL